MVPIPEGKRIIRSINGLVMAAVIVTSLAYVGLQRSQASLSGVSSASTQGRDELRIQLTGSGFVPSEIEHAAGTFAIAVENTNLAGDYLLRLKAEDGTLLKEISVQKGSSAWTVSLATGHYTITEASNPNWLCSLTVK